jgi:hypothetical protein
MPGSILLQSFTVTAPASANYLQVPLNFYVAGSNDYGLTWTQLFYQPSYFVMHPLGWNSGTSKTFVVNSAVPYSLFRLIVTTVLSSSNGYTSFHWALTGSVYSLLPQVTAQGLTPTAPVPSSATPAPPAYQFPPPFPAASVPSSAFAGGAFASSLFVNSSYMPGTYAFSASTQCNGQSAPGYAFDSSITDMWMSGMNGCACSYASDGSWSSGSPCARGTGLYFGSAVATPGFPAGEWLQITLPGSIFLTTFTIVAPYPVGVFNRAPSTFFVAGSQDLGATWTQLFLQQNFVWYSGTLVNSFSVSATAPFSTFRLIIAGVAQGSDGYASCHWTLYGSVYSPPPTPPPPVGTSAPPAQARPIA